MPGLQGLSRYGAGNTFGQESKQELLREEGGSPINVMSTITPESLTKMMKRMGQGVGAGANVASQAAAGADPSKGLGASPSSGYEKHGKTGEETNKFLGFNKEGFKNTYNWLDQVSSPYAGSPTNAALNLVAPSMGNIRAMIQDD